MKTIALASCIGILAFASANAQELSHFNFDIGGGFTEPAYSSGRYLNTGWNIKAGAGYSWSRYLGTNLNVMYNGFGINGATQTTLGVPGGSVSLFTATVDPVVHLTPHSHFDFYITAGGGFFHEAQQFTAPGSFSTAANVPFFGLNPGASGTTQAPAAYSINRPGWDAGAGVSVGAFHHAKVFAEAKFERMLMSNGPNFDALPVTFGLRW